MNKLLVLCVSFLLSVILVPFLGLVFLMMGFSDVDGHALKPADLADPFILFLAYKRRNLARRKLHEFVIAGVPEELGKRLDGGRWPPVLNSENFGDWVRWNFVRDLKDKGLQFLEYRPKEISEKDLTAVLCELLDIEWDRVVHAAKNEEKACAGYLVLSAVFKKKLWGAFFAFWGTPGMDFQIYWRRESSAKIPQRAVV